MSFFAILRSRFALATRLQTLNQPAQRLIPATSSLFHSSAPTSVLNEANRHREPTKEVGEEIEEHKEEQIRKQKSGTGHWRESLASSSEADVKADRGELPEDEIDESFKKYEETKKTKKTWTHTEGTEKKI